MSESLQKAALSVPEACHIAGIKNDRLYAEINSGRLPSVKIGKRRLIRRESLDKWLKDRETETVHGMGFAA